MLGKLGLFLWIFGLFLSALWLDVSLSATKGSTPMTHSLPTAPDAIVIQWRTLGGLSINRTNIADLTIYADGKSVLGPRFGQGKHRQGQLSMGQIQDLLKFAIDEQRFFRFDSRAVDAEIKAILRQRQLDSQDAGGIALPLGPPYVDGGTTVIMIAADDQQHEVQFQGLAFAIQDYPQIEALQQLRAVELKLLRVAEDCGRGIDPLQNRL